MLWAGAAPARHDMTVTGSLYDPEADFRCPADFHQAFALTYLVERDLASLKQWPLILDEALRTLRPGGIIVIRLKENALLTIFQLANFIERWTEGRYEPLDQISDKGHFVLSLRLTHEQRSASASVWSFGLVTDGRKPASVSRFVSSVLAIGGLDADNRQILVCGPPKVIDDLGPLGVHVELVDQPSDFASRGWITRKKNWLVAASRHENLVIAHDRYVLPADFLAAITRFGGDFDVVAPRQVTTTGAEMPDWVMLADHLGWSVPGWMEYGDYHPFGFVNGGVIIAKRQRLIQTRWSELLFWGQAEDVDLSRRLADRGVTHRLARTVEMTSEPPRSGFIEGFERLPWRDDVYLQTDRPYYGRPTPLGAYGTAPEPMPGLRANRPVYLAGVRAAEVIDKSGLVLGAKWSLTRHGALWTGRGAPELSFKLSAKDETLALVIDFADAATVGAFERLEVNGVACPATSRWNNSVEAEIVPGARVHGAMFQVRIVLASTVPCVLATVMLTGAPTSRGHDLISPISLRQGASTSRWLHSGWHPAEPWGAWTRATKAEIRIPLAAFSRGVLNGSADLIADFVNDDRPQKVSLSCNGAVVGEWVLTAQDRKKRVTFQARRGSAPFVTLTISNTRLHDGGGRRIGIGVQEISLTGGET